MNSINLNILQVLTLKFVKIGLSPTFMVEMMNELDISYHTGSPCQVEIDIDDISADFTKKSNYRCDIAKTSRYGLKSIRWLGPKIWALIPEEVKKS